MWRRGERWGDSSSRGMPREYLENSPARPGLCVPQVVVSTSQPTSNPRCHLANWLDHGDEFRSMAVEAVTFGRRPPRCRVDSIFRNANSFVVSIAELKRIHCQIMDKLLRFARVRRTVLTRALGRWQVLQHSMLFQ